MSIVKRHDVIQTGLYISNEKNAVKKIEEGKAAWVDMSAKEREVVLECLHKNEVNGARQHANLAIDHQKMLKAEFQDTWTATIGTTTTNLRLNKKKFTGRHLKLNLVTENLDDFFEEGEDTTGGDSATGGDSTTGGDTNGGEDTTINYITTINITPTSINGFQALKKKYQYFKINKVSIKFVSNSAQNLSPIICRYMPPMGKEGDLDKLNIDYITKYAESVGTTPGFVSLHMPPCLVKKGEFNKENEFQYGENGYCLPNLNKDRMLCSYEEDKFYLDYGTFVLESKNIGTIQNIIAQIHYYIDFYTGYDYECAAIVEGGESGGDDSNGGNDDGTSGSGSAGADEGNSNIPDTIPSGIVPRGSSYSKSFKKPTKK